MSKRPTLKNIDFEKLKADIENATVLLIIVTDGETPWPAKGPDKMKVIVVLVREGSEGPSWARTIKVVS